MESKILFVMLALSVLLSACSSDNQNVLRAVQKYKLRGEPIEKILEDRVASLRTAGVHAESIWVAPKFEDSNFEVKAVIRVANRNYEEPYVWALTEQPTATNAKSRIWSVKATSEAAKAVVRGDKWAGVAGLPTR
ncbi:MAG: hypothetical protein H6617_12060 [Bdellovibrionaceae bacterium]|nr:hypothetical protein [Bdellovibrionales bacterium]MCB9255408.1 hypothetical protein [Pseudobdellovibrionaceae bacterium]